MTPERWAVVKSVFNAVTEVPREDRARVLSETCGVDQDLYTEVESLLLADDRATHALEVPAAELVGPLPDESFPMPERIGPYRVLGEVGRGGMGVVLLAERDDAQYRKRVAIKLVRRGVFYQDLLARFLRERQILADLDHPGIARLLDGGATPDGHPYLVMELVEGTPIDAYCHERGLDTRARIELIRKVSSAVQYAHQKLVVHRDIKPDNILVTPDGQPKLLDFGIAKLFEESGEPLGETRTGLRAMTPEYASPEQVLGHRVSTSTDVYSLGVVLYELLTGEFPYRLQGLAPHELARIICEREPERPSAVLRRAGRSFPRDLRGDLDNIVLTALRKDPARRYPSVERLDDDLRRTLQGLPVRARPDTVRYRAGKFVRRNRFGVAAATLVLLSLVTGMIATVREARIADRRLREVRRLANSLIFDLHDAIQGVTGATTAREVLVEKALEYLGKLAREAPGDESLQRDLATAYEKIGDIQGRPSIANLGQYDAALKSYDESLRIRQTLFGRHPGDGELAKELAASHLRKGQIFGDRGRLREAIESYREAIHLLEPLYKLNPLDRVVARDLGVAQMLTGDALGNPDRPNLGDPNSALATYRKGYAIQARLTRADPTSGEKRHFLAAHTTRLAVVAASLGKRDEASRGFAAALDLFAGLRKDYPRVGSIRGDRAAVELSYANMLIETDRERALELISHAEGVFAELVTADPANAAAVEDRAAAELKVADLVAPFDPERAVKDYKLALDLYGPILAANQERARVVYQAARAHTALGRLLPDTQMAREHDRAAAALLTSSLKRRNLDRRAGTLLSELKERSAGEK